MCRDGEGKPHPKYCDEYYFCVRGQYERRKCVYPDRWSIEHGQCERFQSVSCGERNPKNHPCKCQHMHTNHTNSLYSETDNGLTSNNPQVERKQFGCSSVLNYFPPGYVYSPTRSALFSPQVILETQTVTVKDHVFPTATLSTARDRRTAFTTDSTRTACVPSTAV